MKLWINTRFRIASSRLHRTTSDSFPGSYHFLRTQLILVLDSSCSRSSCIILYIILLHLVLSAWSLPVYPGTGYQFPHFPKASVRHNFILQRLKTCDHPGNGLLTREQRTSCGFWNRFWNGFRNRLWNCLRHCFRLSFRLSRFFG